MKAAYKALLFLSIFNSTQSYAQHRIKQNEAISIYAEIVELKENAVHYRFYRQSKVHELARSEVQSIDLMVFDPDLLSDNFNLREPYEIEGLQLKDNIIFQSAKKYNGLSYNSMDTKILSVVNDSVSYITAVDGSYILDQIAKSEIESVQYSAYTRKYLFIDSIEMDYRDIVEGADGELRYGYVYALEYLGVKFSSTALSDIDFEIGEGGKLKMKNITGLEFISYNDISRVHLSNGQKMITQFYKNPAKPKAKKLNEYPKARLKIGGGYGFRTNASGALFSTITDNGVRILTQKEGEMNTLAELARLSLEVQINKRWDLGIYGGYLSSSPITYITEEYYTDLDDPIDYFSTKTDIYQMRLLKIGASAGVRIGKLRIAAGPNVVRTANSFSGESYLFVNGSRYLKTQYSRVYQSKGYAGIDASLSYDIDLGRVSLVPSVSYSKFQMDHSRSVKNEIASGAFFIPQRPFTVSGSEPTYSFKGNVVPTIEEWEIINIGIDIAYTF